MQSTDWSMVRVSEPSRGTLGPTDAAACQQTAGYHHPPSQLDLTDGRERGRGPPSPGGGTEESIGRPFESATGEGRTHSRAVGYDRPPHNPIRAPRWQLDCFRRSDRNSKEGQWRPVVGLEACGCKPPSHKARAPFMDGMPAELVSLTS